MLTGGAGTAVTGSWPRASARSWPDCGRRTPGCRGTSRSRLSTYMSGKVVPSAALMVRMRRVALKASETVTHAAG